MVTFLKIGHLGQLGNQLFQFAALYSLSLHLNEPMFVPIENIYTVRYKCKVYQSHLNLFDCFDLHGSFLEKTSNLHPTNYYKEPSSSYDPAFWELPNGTDIDGYFQSDKYFIKNRNELLSLLKFKPVIHDISESILELCGKEPVSIHVRRREAVTVQCDLKEDYYYKAIKILQDVGKTNFIVISDDIEWCKDKFKDIPNVHYSENTGKYVDLCLMSLCKHNIICNSSFGWWGTWLNQNPNKLVVAPCVWYPKTDTLQRHALETPDIRCENWSILSQ